MFSSLQVGIWDIIRDVAQILILATALYYAFRLVRGTRSAQMLLGLGLVLLTVIGLTIILNLEVLAWLLGTLSVYVAVSLVVIFQPEIRRALAMVGGGALVGGGSPHRAPVADQLVSIVTRLAARRHGALLAIERDIALKSFLESGVTIDAPLDADLLLTIFFPRTPLHDGGVILRGDRVLAARCVFPLTQRSDLDGELGTRHRAALGLSEETDAVVVVVSEETGSISIAHDGRLFRHLTPEKLRRYLAALLPERRVRDIAWRRVVEDFVMGDSRRNRDNGEGEIRAP
ncbi:MAG: diadenylate cyclase CdaA [Kiritimatiellia bacterium]